MCAKEKGNPIRAPFTHSLVVPKQEVRDSQAVSPREMVFAGCQRDHVTAVKPVIPQKGFGW